MGAEASSRASTVPASPEHRDHIPATTAVPIRPMTFPLEPYVESIEAIYVYLQLFDPSASTRALQMPRDKWALKLSSGLRRTSYEVYAKLVPIEQNNYYCLKEALLKRRDLNVMTYQKRFRSS